MISLVHVHVQGIVFVKGRSFDFLSLGRGGVCEVEDLVSARLLPPTRHTHALTNKTDIFPVEKLCMIWTLSSMIFSLLYGTPGIFFSKIFQSTSPPPSKVKRPTPNLDLVFVKRLLLCAFPVGRTVLVA